MTNELLAAAVDRLTFLAWTKTKDATRSGAKRPKPIARPSNNFNRASTGRLKGAATFTVDEVKRRLALPRRAVKKRPEWEKPGSVGSD